MSEEDKKVTYKKRSLGFPIGDPFYNHWKATEGGPLQLEIWNNRLGLEFAKYDPTKKGADARESAKVTISNEVAFIIHGVVEAIVRDRYTAWKSKAPYASFEIPIENVFIDKEGIVHSIGTFFFRTVSVDEDHGVNQRVQIAYKSDKYDFKTTFGSVLMPVVVSKLPDAVERVDPYDVPLYRFLHLLKEYHSYGTILYSGLNKIAELLLGWNRGGSDEQGGGQQRFNGGGNNRPAVSQNRGAPSFRTNANVEDADIKW